MRKIPLRWFLTAGMIYLALMIILFLVFILPQNLRIKELKAKLNSENLQSSVTEHEEELTASRNALKEAGADLKNRLVIPEKSILTSLLSLAQRANIRVSSALPIPQTDIAKAAGETSFRVVFTGSYRQITDFIHILESDPALFRINRLNLENAGNLRRGEIDVVAYLK